ncbi:MAG: DUF4878 domain-containing protein [Prevotellaceae bacterium]|jgi:hypothetical protein|nr:DUF4878 domain-containing protein [Prevotellaceae bacterium]
MKKIIGFLMLAVMALFTVSCGSGGNTPSSIEKSILAEMQKGNYEKAIEISLDNLDKEFSAEERKQFVEGFSEKMKQSDAALGGIKSFEIEREEISEDKNSAVVISKIVYGNGEEKNQTNQYVLKDGVWKLASGK